MATRKGILAGKLMQAGFLPFEAKAMAKGYTTEQFRTIPYLIKLVRTRRLYIANLKSRGYADSLIVQYIKDLYVHRKWGKGRTADPWLMVKEYRKKAIKDGEYKAPERKKVSHHGVKRTEVTKQKQRRGNTMLDKYERGRMKGY